MSMPMVNVLGLRPLIAFPCASGIAANCLGRCTDKAGGAGDWQGHQSKCLRCDWQLIRCVRNATIRR